MNNPAIFCIVGESGAGKSTYIDLLLNSKKLKNVKELKYCTTRRKRYEEEDSYYFTTNDEFKKILREHPDELIEHRYYKKYDEEVYYYTLKEHIEIPNCDILICAASVSQALSYMARLDNVYIIDLKVELKERIKRLLNRATTNSEVLEICRRTLEEQEEYSKLETVDKNIIHIYNDNSKYKFSNTGNMLYSLITAANLKSIEDYILSHI